MSERVDTLRVMQEALNACKTTDCGAIGKAYEIAIRAFIQPKSKRNGVTKSNRWYGDLLLRRNGETIRIEIKTGCGELATVESDIFEIAELLQKADIVIYCPEVHLDWKPEQQGFVFTRDEFLDMLSNYDGNGALLRVKPATNGGYRVSFQSFLSDGRPKASAKIANYIWECCYNQPTVEDFYGSED